MEEEKKKILKDPKSYYRNMAFALKKRSVDERSVLPDSQEEYPQENTEYIKNNANSIIQNAKEEAKKIKEEAYKEGLKEGKSTGKKQAKDILKEQLEIISCIIKEIEIFKKKIYRDSEKNIVELSLVIAEKIIRKEIGENKKNVVSIIRDTLKGMPVLGRLMIYINPEDYEWIFQNEDGVEDITTNNSYCFISEESIEKGGCIIETDRGSIDTQISSQLKRIYNEILE